MAASTLVVHKRALGQPLGRPAYAPSIYSPGGYATGGYGYPGQQSPWPSPAATTPPPPWSVPVPPPAPPGPPAPAPSWPDFATPPITDPDATSVFDTSSPTDTHPVVDETVAKAKAGTDAKVDANVDAAVTSEGSEPAPGVGAPHWDTKRNTYVQWDPELKAWMQWDYAKNEWHGMK
jgi:hypothetical protein